MLSQDNPLSAFQTWAQTFGKEYLDDAAEVEKRLAIFRDNAAMIAAHNANKDSTFKMAINQFADLTHEEFKATRLGLKPTLSKDG